MRLPWFPLVQHSKSYMMTTYTGIGKHKLCCIIISMMILVTLGNIFGRILLSLYCRCYQWSLSSIAFCSSFSSSFFFSFFLPFSLSRFMLGYLFWTWKVSQYIPQAADGWFCKGGIICYSQCGGNHQNGGIICGSKQPSNLNGLKTSGLFFFLVKYPLRLLWALLGIIVIPAFRIAEQLLTIAKKIKIVVILSIAFKAAS